jgi:hypothetical protein
VAEVGGRLLEDVLVPSDSTDEQLRWAVRPNEHKQEQGDILHCRSTRALPRASRRGDKRSQKGSIGSMRLDPPSAGGMWGTTARPNLSSVSRRRSSVVKAAAATLTKRRSKARTLMNATSIRTAIRADMSGREEPERRMNELRRPSSCIRVTGALHYCV